MDKNQLKVQKQLYGQLVIGPPGSGKSTYCAKIASFYKQINRKFSIVNLDPANENIQYEPEIDIMTLINVEQVMERHNLGPNGALIYCMEYLELNFHWFLHKLQRSSSNYFLFDCPGQVELYTHHKSMRNMFEKLQNLGYNLCTVHLVDSHYCSEPHKFISTLILSLNTMLQMGLPHINVLSKADLLQRHSSKLHFNIDFYTEVLDLKYLLDALDQSQAMSKYKKLNKAIVSMVEDFSLVSFQPLDINRTESIVRLYKMIDKANGYAFSGNEEQTVNTMLAVAVGAESGKSKAENDYDPYVR